MILYVTAFAALFGFVAPMTGEKKDNGKTPVVQRIEVKWPGFPKGNVRKPIVIRNAKELQQVKVESVRKQITKQVDFDKQYVVLFAWSGSGQDRLNAKQKKIGKKVVFTYSPGLTRDLRGHVYCFAIRNGVEFSVVTGRFGAKLRN